MRRLVVLPLAVALASVGVAFAAGLAVDGNSVGAGAAVVGKCDTSVTVTFTTSGSSVTHVTVADLSNDCDGAQMILHVVNGSGSSLGSGSLAVPVDAGSTSVTVPVSPNPSAPAVAGVEIAMVGP